MNKLTTLIEAAKAVQTARHTYYDGAQISDQLYEFSSSANPATILELCVLLEKAEEALEHMIRAAAEQHCGLKIADEALTAIKQWKEMK